MKIPPLSYLERFRNEGTRTYSNHSGYSEAEDSYRPNRRHDGVGIRVFEVPLQQLNIYRANPAEDLLTRYLRDNCALFCVHPQVEDQCRDDLYLRTIQQQGTVAAEILAEPTSSTRTLLVEGAAPHALKVHFPFRVSRYTRKMRDEVIEQAVAVSRELEQDLDRFEESFGFFPEVIGVACKNQDSSGGRGENWGYLIRDMRPLPYLTEERCYVPGFALYGTDYFNPSKEVLLWDLIGVDDPLEFVLSSVMLPIIRHWIQCFRGFGYMLEPHGQNVLLELDSRHRVTRIIHRDLSVGIDMRRRRDQGLASDHLNNYNRMENGEFLSITYDMFMGSHFFDRIVACVQQKWPDLSVEDFRAPCRRLYGEMFPEHERYMPTQVHYFSEKRDKFNKPLYQNTGREPEWRP